MNITLRISGPLLIMAALLAGGWWYAGDEVRRWTGKPQVQTQTGQPGRQIVMRTPGGLLEISRIKSYERFSRSDTRSIGPISLGTTESMIEVPALFRYHIEMAREWPVTCTPKACIVRAGPVKPTLPAGIYTSELKTRTSSGWARFNKHENLAQLTRDAEALLASRANDARNRDLALSVGRKTVEEFARTWLLKDSTFKRDPDFRVVVLFPGEALAQVAPDDAM